MSASLGAALRRWRCDHFDHPFRRVTVSPSFSSDDTGMNYYYCTYCRRRFDIPVYPVNCRCVTRSQLKEE